MSEWFENEAFWARTAEVMFSEERVAAAPEEVRAVLRLADLEAGGRALDLCCGIGRHTVALAEAGFDVTGVDLSPTYLERAEGRARDAGLTIEFVRADMRVFAREAEFDLAVNLYTSFGYSRAREDDRQVIENLWRSLKPGGALVMEMAGRELIASRFRERDWHREGDAILLQERRLSDDWSWIEAEWTVIRGERRETFRLANYLYTATELRRLLEAQGFEDVCCYGDLQGSPYDQNGRRLVAVAHRPR